MGVAASLVGSLPPGPVTARTLLDTQTLPLELELERTSQLMHIRLPRTHQTVPILSRCVLVTIGRLGRAFYEGRLHRIACDPGSPRIPGEWQGRRLVYFQPIILGTQLGW